MRLLLRLGGAVLAHSVLSVTRLLADAVGSSCPVLRDDPVWAGAVLRAVLLGCAAVHVWAGLLAWAVLAGAVLRLPVLSRVVWGAGGLHGCAAVHTLLPEPVLLRVALLLRLPVLARTVLGVGGLQA